MYDINMYDSSYGANMRRLHAERVTAEAIQKQRHEQYVLKHALRTEQIKEVYRNSSKIADLVYIQGYGEFLLDKNDNLIKVQKEQDNEL